MAAEEIKSGYMFDIVNPFTYMCWRWLCGDKCLHDLGAMFKQCQMKNDVEYLQFVKELNESKYLQKTYEKFRDTVCEKFIIIGSKELMAGLDSLCKMHMSPEETRLLLINTPTRRYVEVDDGELNKCEIINATFIQLKGKEEGQNKK